MLDNVVSISMAIDLVVIPLALDSGATMDSLGRLVVVTTSLKMAIQRLHRS